MNSVQFSLDGTPIQAPEQPAPLEDAAEPVRELSVTDIDAALREANERDPALKADGTLDRRFGRPDDPHSWGAGRPKRPDGGRDVTGQVVFDLNHLHEAMISFIIAYPQSGLREIATHFGYSQGWVSRLMNSDLFKSRLRERQDEVYGQALGSLSEKLQAAADVGVEKLTRMLETSEDPKFVKETTSDVLTRLGFGAPKSPAAVQVNGAGSQVMVVADAQSLARAREVMRNVGQSNNVIPLPAPSNEN